MKTRIAIFAAALVLSWVFYWRDMSNISPEDAPLMATDSARFGAWLGGFFLALLIVGVLYFIGKGIRKLVRRRA